MGRGHSYIESRLRDVLAGARAAAAWPPERHARFEEAARLIEAIFHYERLAASRQLRDSYDPLDPGRAPPPAAAGAPDYGAFMRELEPILAAANFEETALDPLSQRAAAKGLSDLKIKASDKGIRAIRCFSRGAKMQTIEASGVFGLIKRRVAVEILDEVILVVAFRGADEVTPKERKSLERMRGNVRPGAVLIKLFANVARDDLMTLHPGAQPAMRTRDQLFLGVPALAGGMPLLLQIGPAITVIFTLIAVYFGAASAIDESAYKRAIAAISGLIAVGGFIMRQWMKYQRQSLIYQKRLADTVYYRNVANNHGVIATLIAAAEEQDVKEAVLAYWALLAAGKPLDKATIDKAAETLLRERCNLTIDFEIHDALAKLERLGLVIREGEAYGALVPEEALTRLDEAWDGLFQYAKAEH